MDAERNKAGKVRIGKPAAKKAAAAARPQTKLATRIMAERKAAAEMTVKIRRRSKELAADADRLLSRVL